MESKNLWEMESKSDIMTEEEHQKNVKKMESKYMGKAVFNDEEYLTIIGVNVDYRKSRQDMNRLIADDGSVWFISDLNGGVLYDNK